MEHKLTVKQAIKELQDLERQGKGDYQLEPIVFLPTFSGGGHETGLHGESWINDVDDEYKRVWLGGS